MSLSIQNLFCVREDDAGAVCSRIRYRVSSELLQVHGTDLPTLWRNFAYCSLLIQDCGDVVASKFFPIEGPDGRQHPLCERDYFRRLNLICAKCGMALRGSYITACSSCIPSEF